MCVWQLVCGLYYYTYNEMAFMVTDMLDPTSQVPPCTDRASVAPASGADCAEGTCVPRTPPRAVTLQHTSRGCRLPRRLRDLGSSAAVGGQHGQARRHHHRRQRRFQQAPHPER